MNAVIPVVIEGFAWVQLLDVKAHKACNFAEEDTNNGEFEELQ